jgi:hypothetical protein
MHPPSIATQFGLTLTKLATIEECIHDQVEWLAIEDEADWEAHRDRELRNEQKESRGVEPEARIWQTEEMEEVREIRLEQHKNKTRWVPTAFILDPEPAPQTYEVPL